MTLNSSDEQYIRIPAKNLVGLYVGDSKIEVMGRQNAGLVGL